MFAVDNVLQRIADPLFIGATKLAHCEVGSKVIKKAAPDERVGVMCLEDGHPSIVEYYELTDEMRNAKNEKGEPAYNFGVILNYLFRVDALDGKISWQPIENAQGCNVRYGIAPDKLYQSWLVYGADEVTLSTLMSGQTYYVCVDSFNENGVTTGKIIKMEG